jgi:STAS domain-containing protein
MPFRIETAARGRFTIFILSGRIDASGITELRRLCEGETDLRDIVFDLKGVSVIDREVMRLFVRCEANGVQLENCTPYIREWMEREKD